MPTRTRPLIILLAAALIAGGWAFAQEAPSSGYRIRPERGYGQHLHVDSETNAEPVPARVSASLSDEEPATEDAGEREPETESTEQGAGESKPGPGFRVQGSVSQGTSGSSTEYNEAVGREKPPTTRSALRHAGATQIATEKSPLPLAPRSESGGRQLARPNAAAGLGSLGTVGGALAVVLGLFVVVVWVTRRVGPPGSASLPKEAVEVLGRSALSGQHALQLVRVGSRLLLVALSSQGAATLTEITDPHEVERLTALCLRQRPGSASNTFAQTVAELERQTSGRSFVDQRRPAASSVAGRPRTTRAA